MAEFRMPSLGADMEAGTLVEWLKQPGEKVTRGDVVAVVETQKGAIEVECFEDGTLDQLLVEPGTKVPVGTPLATIRAARGAKPEKHAPPPSKEMRTEPREAPPAPVVAAPPMPSPLAPLRAPAGTRPLVSPAARRIAMERGIDLSRLSGSGPGGAVTSTDVLAAATVAEKLGAAPAAKPRGRLDLGEMRKAIAAAMARSKREIPHYYLSQDVDLAAATALLATINAKRAPQERLLMAALLLKAAALALAKFEDMNGFWREGRYEPSQAVHVGAAVSIRGGGLIAPAIHDTDTLSLDALMARLRDLVVRARAGSLRSSELADATATVSNLGERGVKTLFGVIYPPQVALVGFGTPSPRPWVAEGQVVVRPVVTLTLAADHRASEGHRGALFLAEIERLLQTPEVL
jgi:pyruvate dehydrogenase E2 component (dihydrolipoyllysine-residue acetyltransferase)